MRRGTDDWGRILQACSIGQRTTEIMAPIFAATIEEGTFSKGDAELPDFLATIIHESQGLTKLKESGKYTARRIRELASGANAGTRWRALLPRAEFLADNEYAFFEACYGGRMGNGPEGSGDGALYPGRAFIGITGKDNYSWLGDLVGQDLTINPSLCEQPTFALEFSIMWWEKKVPDRLLGDERAIRRVVNGGYYGLTEVEKLAAAVWRALA